MNSIDLELDELFALLFERVQGAPPIDRGACAGSYWSTPERPVLSADQMAETPKCESAVPRLFRECGEREALDKATECLVRVTYLLSLAPEAPASDEPPSLIYAFY